MAGAGKEDLNNSSRLDEPDGIDVSLLVNPDIGVREVSSVRHMTVGDFFHTLEMDG